MTGDCKTLEFSDHHGVALRTLYLTPSDGKDGNHFIFNVSTIGLVTNTCKALVEMGITMRRRWSILSEIIAVLKAVGCLYYLSDLDLVFHPSDLASGTRSAMNSIPLSDWADSEHHIRGAIINSAIDIDMAKAVFNTIMSSSKSSRDDANFHTNTPRLQMSLKETDPNDFDEDSDFNLRNMVREIGRRWVVMRHCDEEDLDAQRDE